MDELSDARHGKSVLARTNEYLPNPIKFVAVPPATRVLRCRLCRSEDLSLCPKGTSPQTYRFECDECDTFFSERQLRSGGPTRFYSEDTDSPMAIKCPACSPRNLRFIKGGGQPSGFQLVCEHCEWTARIPHLAYLSTRMWEM